MTDPKTVLIFFDDYFNKIGLDYMIHGSSLLHIIREGELNLDAEVDLVCHGDDITDEIMAEFNKSYFVKMYPCKEKYGEMYFSPIKDLTTGAFVALTPLWNKKGHVYLSVIDNMVVEWPNKELYDKSNWSTIKYLDREFNVPGDPKKYLEMWYGNDWMTPLSCTWNDNKSKKTWEELQ